MERSQVKRAQYVKIIDIAKEKLINPLEDVGFVIDIKISKKQKEVSLTSCREFFNSNSRISLDRRV